MNPCTNFVSAATLATCALAQAPVYDVSGQPGDELGRSVAWIGDVDLDGVDDFAAGAPFGDGWEVDAGYVKVFSGQSGQELFTFRGENKGDRLGYSVAGLGDIDGDGSSDLIVGAPFHEHSVPSADWGAVYIVSGATAQAVKKFSGHFTDDYLGWSVACAGDFDFDGVPDYAFGAPGDDPFAIADSGMVYVFSGASHSQLRGYAGSEAGDMLGFSLAGAGDVTGDGKPDLVAGAPYYDTGFTQPAGRAYLLSGAANHSKVLLATGQAGGQLGHAVTAGFDFDADGVPDMAIGEPFRKLSGLPAGRVHVVSGATLAVAHVLAGLGDDKVGYSVAGLADADGDGKGDLMVGAPGGDVAANVDLGWVRVFSGASWQHLYQWNGKHLAEQMGYSVASAGKVNADPWTDMLAGAPSSNANGAYSGRALLVLGSAPEPTAYCTAKTNSSGCVPVITYTGCASVSISNGFHLRALNVLEGYPGILIWSMSSQAMPFMGGTLCVAPPILRTPGQVATPNAGYPCTGAYDFHFSQAYMAISGLSAGDDVFAQYWSRDTGFPPPQNVGLTGGLAFSVLP